MFRRYSCLLGPAAASAAIPKPAKTADAAAVGKAIITEMQPLLKKQATASTLGPIYDVQDILLKSLQPINKDLSVYAFGSTVVYGVHEPKSDVDFVILSPDDVADGMGLDAATQQANGLQNQLLGRVAREIKRANPLWRIEEVKRTRVPVLRIKNLVAEFDVTAHRRNGVRNSALLRAYYDQCPQARWLALAVKHWSKRCGMNGPLGYLTSYGFNILVIYYCIQRGLMQHVPIQIANVAEVNAIPKSMPLEVPEDPEVLGKQVLDFLQYYLEEFPITEEVVSLSREGKTMRTDLNWTLDVEASKQMMANKVSYRLCIEDPYEIDLNVGRNITAFKLDMFRKHFAKGIESGLGLVP